MIFQTDIKVHVMFHSANKKYVKIHYETKCFSKYHSGTDGYFDLLRLKNAGLVLVSVKWKGWVPDSDLQLVKNRFSWDYLHTMSIKTNFQIHPFFISGLENILWD